MDNIRQTMQKDYDQIWSNSKVKACLKMQYMRGKAGKRMLTNEKALEEIKRASSSAKEAKKESTISLALSIVALVIQIGRLIAAICS